MIAHRPITSFYYEQCKSKIDNDGGDGKKDI